MIASMLDSLVALEQGAVAEFEDGRHIVLDERDAVVAGHFRSRLVFLIVLLPIMDKDTQDIIGAVAFDCESEAGGTVNTTAEKYDCPVSHRVALQSMQDLACSKRREIAMLSYRSSPA